MKFQGLPIISQTTIEAFSHIADEQGNEMLEFLKTENPKAFELLVELASDLGPEFLIGANVMYNLLRQQLIEDCKAN